MATNREIQVIQKMMKRKEYAGIFFGIAIAAAAGAGVLHEAANPEIAQATLDYTAERIAHHQTLLAFRNYFAIGSGASLIIGFFMGQSVEDLAQ